MSTRDDVAEQLAPPPPTDFGLRAEHGRAARRRAPRSSHAGWAPPPDRPDPVALLEEQEVTREPDLVPIRHRRMMVSPFTFYRGAALLMATDLARTPVSGIVTQVCGDAHLSNFGVFGTPERAMVFDINDFDETLPGPWEWDVKRLVASVEVAGRHRGFDAGQRRDLDLAVVRAYRERLLRLAGSGVLAGWYDRLDADRVVAWIETEHRAKRLGRKQVERMEADLAKARTKDSTRAAAKLVEVVDGEPRIAASPPLVVPVEDLVPLARDRERAEDWMRGLIASYLSTLQPERHPMAEFSYVHMARKVVGVGSVGTRAWVVLLRGRDEADTLVLQAKQAERSVLERFLPPSRYDNHGERVVRGQRLMQAAGDVFLGWQRVAGVDGVVRDYYLRQLYDWKGGVDVEVMDAAGARAYAQLCGEALARAHARTGDRIALAAYLGRSDVFDRAVADFAADYADQNDRDYAAFLDAVASGRLAAAEA
ncbi:DUF2252 domain-containing protein [Isoptericola nanjingensis]|uniref:DUF2252 domain-containing protein n=1 Tax=Isoptericola TaxID=254250 RepID=UPI003D21BDF5|nr:DUF2252 domain-containing protein [Isoptericola sp. QY 916]